jgi:hypothetical protein
VTRRGGWRDPLLVRGECPSGYHILKVEAAEPGAAIAAVLLGIQKLTGKSARADFAWPDGSHAGNLLRFLVFGTGNAAAVTREILRRHQPNPSLRPGVHVG